MSTEGKHAYRFVYLKSEQWQTVRIAALAREKGKCQICGEESISNDAHHIWYPESIWETTRDHLVILCRPCHDFLHTMMPECKTNDEDAGRAMWSKFSNALIAWRIEKFHLLSNADLKPVSLRKRLEELTAQNEELRNKTITEAEYDSISRNFLKKIQASITKFLNE